MGLSWKNGAILIFGLYLIYSLITRLAGIDVFEGVGLVLTFILLIVTVIVAIFMHRGSKDVKPKELERSIAPFAKWTSLILLIFSVLFLAITFYQISIGIVRIGSIITVLVLFIFGLVGWLHYRKVK